jgi:hypothetical protein
MTIDGIRTLLAVPLSGAPNVMSFENPPGAQTQSTDIDHMSMSVRPHARCARTPAKQDGNVSLSRAAQTLQPAIPLAGSEGGRG